jgi:hypothetical protein
MTTDFGTHPTVLVVVSMLLALVPANSACPSAGLKSDTYHLFFEGRLAGHYLTGGIAHVGTVEAEPYAAGEHLYVTLSDAGVGAGGAALFAVKAGLDAFHQHVGIDRSAAGVCLKHSPRVVAQGISPSRSYSRFRSIPHAPSKCNRCAFRLNRFVKRVCLPP